MNLTQMRYFMVIAETENISRAAEMLYVAQPSLSQMLKRLEDEIGTPLFERNGKILRLNTAGRIYLKHVNEVFTALENAEREIKESCDTLYCEVCLSFESASLLLPQVVKSIISMLPNIKLKIIQSGHESDLRIYSHYEAQECDNSKTLMEEPLGVVLPFGNSLLGKERITISDLEGAQFISLNHESNLFKTVSHFCSKVGFFPNYSIFVNSPAVMRGLLNLGLGIAFVPKYTWYASYSDTSVFVPIEDCPMSRHIILSWNPDKYMTTYIRCCMDIITKFFEEYTQKFQ